MLTATAGSVFPLGLHSLLQSKVTNMPFLYVMVMNITPSPISQYELLLGNLKAQELPSAVLLRHWFPKLKQLQVSSSLRAAV